MKPYYTLAIETSCDETGVAIVESRGLFSHRIIVNLLASQIALHRQFGGVVPGLAAREHVKNLPLLIKRALKQFDVATVNAIAYTDTPGLEPALLVGRTFAQAFTYGLNKPAYPVNHLYGHLYAGFLETSFSESLFPAVGLVISGGHTQLYQWSSPASMTLLGETIDDALGEALDKGARLLDLPYPGGPKLEKLAHKGKLGVFTFPSPMLRSNDFRFSFAGLKTSLLYKVRDLVNEHGKLDDQMKADLALAYQTAAFNVIIKKTTRAVVSTQARSLLIGGGVAANQTLRYELQKTLTQELNDVRFVVPNREFCTDNGAMIALAHAIPRFASLNTATRQKGKKSYSRPRSRRR